jgi:hypothetical protein
MEAGDLLDQLVALAQQAGIVVRQLPRAATGPAEGEGGARSGLCRMRGELWLILAPGEPLEDRIEAVANALRDVAPQWLEDRYLPPAVRDRLEHARGPDPSPAGPAER